MGFGNFNVSFYRGPAFCPPPFARPGFGACPAFGGFGTGWGGFGGFGNMGGFGGYRGGFPTPYPVPYPVAVPTPYPVVQQVPVPVIQQVPVPYPVVQQVPVQQPMMNAPIAGNNMMNTNGYNDGFNSAMRLIGGVTAPATNPANNIQPTLASLAALSSGRPVTVIQDGPEGSLSTGGMDNNMLMMLMLMMAMKNKKLPGKKEGESKPAGKS